MKSVLYLVKNSRTDKALLDYPVELCLALYTVYSRSVCYVIVNAHREGVGLLEHHANPLAQHIDIHLILIDIHTVQQDIAGNAAAFHQVVHAVQALQESRLAAAGRTDERRDLFFGDGNIDIFQCMEAAVIQVHVFNFEFIHHAVPFSITFWQGSRQ